MVARRAQGGRTRQRLDRWQEKWVGTVAFTSVPMHTPTTPHPHLVYYVG
ncbi:hypothetical protein Pcinc_023432, partial [Petrolisthes cinctipes]